MTCAFCGRVRQLFRVKRFKPKGATMSYPTGTQNENDQARLGHTVNNKAADGSPLDPNTPPWAQTAPVNNTPPAITGTATVGNTLTCSTGAWTFGGGYTYQWKRGGTNIAGATTASHLVVVGDKTFALTCTVTATNTKGSASATSAATAVVP
jgi:hypothetical protein